MTLCLVGAWNVLEALAAEKQGHLDLPTGATPREAPPMNAVLLDQEVGLRLVFFGSVFTVMAAWETLARHGQRRVD